MKMRTLLSWFAIFSISLIVTVSCTLSPSKPIRLGFNAWPGWYPWQVAREEKLFEANKVQVKLKWFGDVYSDSINALKAGQLDANTQTLNDTISSLAAGADQVAVLVTDYSAGSDAIIVREGINSINDLKGKKVAAEEGTVDHFLLLLGLHEASLTQRDINFQHLKPKAATDAFVAGKVDAVGVYAPFTTKALQRLGSKVLFSSGDFPGAISDLLVVNRQLINERPQEVQALVNTWFDTLDFIRANKDKAYQSMAKLAGVTLEEYKTYEDGLKLLNSAENLQTFKNGDDMTHLPLAAPEISKFLAETGTIKHMPDLSKLFDDRFVRAYAASH